MKRHPYIIATLTAALLASVVWLLTPITYSAKTTLTDEYREMDLIIGLNVVNAQIRDLSNGSNNGINDIEIYCQALKTESFARSISKMKVPDKNTTFGDYLGEEDTLKHILENIDYNYSSRKNSITISYTDHNPRLASQILDSITILLQDRITASRHSIIENAIKNTRKTLQESKERYNKAEEEYISFADRNLRAKTKKASEEEKRLEKEVSLAEKSYQDAMKQYARQLALKQKAYNSFAVVMNNTVPQHDNRNFLLYFFAFLILALLAAKGIILYSQKPSKKVEQDWGDFFSPWSLTIFTWTADIILYFIQGDMYPIGSRFIGCFSVWIGTLIPASLLSYWLTQESSRSREVDYRQPISTPSLLFHTLCVISGLLTLIYALRLWSIVSQFDLANILYNLRTYIIEDNSVTGLLNHVQGLNFALFVVGLWMYPKISKWLLFYIIVVNLIFEIFRMEKSGILIMILGTIFMLYERQKMKIRSILITFAGIIVLFFFFNLAKEDVESEAESTFLDFFGMYVTSPMVAFEHLYPDLSGNFGENTFCIIYPYLNMLGMNLEYMDRLQEFVWVPIPTNVYTIMQPFYNDFGILGIGFFGIIYGVIFGVAYRRFRTGDPVYICIYTYLVEVIIIQFYNDNLLQNIVLFLEFCFFVYILTQQRYKFSFTAHESHYK